METKTMCLHQLFPRPQITNIPVHIEGAGDCKVCTPDWDNQNCTLFVPVTYQTTRPDPIEDDMWVKGDI